MIVRAKAKKIKSNNLTKSNREESNIAIVILEKEQFDRTIIISHFEGINDIFADRIILSLVLWCHI